MSRATNSVQTRARHKKWLKRAKGYRGRRSKIFKLAKVAVLKAGQHAYHDRKKKKTLKRQEWQVSINAAARLNNTTYSRLINSLKNAKIELNRKVLAELAIDEPKTFTTVVATAQKK